MRLAEIQHQERALSILRRALSTGRTHHAYLFEGPDGVGKESAARGLAARLLCTDAADDPNQGALFGDEPAPPPLDACGQCESCRLFESGNHPDFTLVDRSLQKQHPDRAVRQRKGLFLGVEIIRHFLIAPAGRRPAVRAGGVFLLREAERMNEAAQNALLKTLEEPPGQTALILVSASAQRLLPTIRSRCQTIPFDLLPPAFVAEQLQTLRGLDAHAARTLAALSDGRLGAAAQWHACGLLSALDEIAAALRSATPNDPETLSKALVATAESLAPRLGAVAEEDDEDDDGESAGRKSGKTVGADAQRDALKLCLMLAGALLRDGLLGTIAADEDLRRLPTHADDARTLAARLGTGGCQEAIEATAAAETLLDRNVAPQLACERFAVALKAQPGGD